MMVSNWSITVVYLNGVKFTLIITCVVNVLNLIDYLMVSATLPLLIARCILKVDGVLDVFKVSHSVKMEGRVFRLIITVSSIRLWESALSVEPATT